MDWLKISEEGLAHIAAEEYKQRAVMSLQRQGLSLVCVTKGSRGATAWLDSYSVSVTAMDIKPLDTTGAGDCFWAAFLNQMLQQSACRPEKGTVLKALKYATAAAAICVMRHGAMPAMPAHDEIMSIMESLGSD